MAAWMPCGECLCQVPVGWSGDKASGSAGGTSIILFIVVKLNPILNPFRQPQHTKSSKQH